jgi:aminoglycoside phosphotransferase (APT) family kinase protein
VLVGVSAAASRFAFGGAIRSIERFGGGHINESWLVAIEGSNARFLLQRINRHVFPRPDLVMRNTELVTAHLGAVLEGVSDRDRRAPSLVPALDGGQHSVDEAGEWWRAWHYIEGAVARDRAQNSDDAYATGCAFGRFQRQLATYDGPPIVETIPGFHDTPRRIAALESAATADAHGRRESVARELETLLSRRALAHALLDHRTALGERLVHNDAKIANVLFDAQSGEPLCVIDLDTVMPGLPLYDFGDMARSTCGVGAEDDPTAVEFSRAMFDALVTGYIEGSGDSSALERSLLLVAAQVITYEQAARFLTDYLDGDVYYRITRPLQNLERCRVQIALLEAMR